MQYVVFYKSDQPVPQLPPVPKCSRNASRQSGSAHHRPRTQSSGRAVEQRLSSEDESSNSSDDGGGQRSLQSLDRSLPSVNMSAEHRDVSLEHRDQLSAITYDVDDAEQQSSSEDESSNSSDDGGRRRNLQSLDRPSPSVNMSVEHSDASSEHRDQLSARTYDVNDVKKVSVTRNRTRAVPHAQGQSLLFVT